VTDPLNRSLVLTTALVALAAPAFLHAANKPGAPAPAIPEVSKEFTLFMDTDFSRELNKAFHRVRVNRRSDGGW
jgi:hypothetical protein